MNTQRYAPSTPLRLLLLPVMLLLGLWLAAPPVQAQHNISFTFDNVQTTDQGVSFDVLVAAAQAGTRLGDTQIYLDYNADAFGDQVKENGRITATLGPDLAANGNYFDPLLNDNTVSRVSIVGEFLGTEEQGLALSGTPVVLFHVTMDAVPGGEQATLSFFEPLMEGQQFESDYATIFGDVLATDLIEIDLPVGLPPVVKVVNEGDGTVRVNWTTPRPAGSANFEVEHAAGRAGFFEPVGVVKGSEAAKQDGAYEYRLDGLPFGVHRFRIRQVDAQGRFVYSEEVTMEVEMAERFLLDPAYPNPFNPQATIRFAVKQAERVSVVLYNALGQRVTLLYEGTPEASAYQSVRIDGSNLSSGLYFVRLQGESFASTQKVTLLK